MTVRIRYLSALRDTTHVRMEEASFADGATLTEVSAFLAGKYGIRVPGPSIMGTVNGRGWSQTPQGAATELREGDEIALFPLLSGG
ncbi:MAG TPA: MoaD/ThiS family protein [Spirochaetia bacterium]|nr:MoaD/ThiS family protein [Spirochaetia bacterium]